MASINISSPNPLAAIHRMTPDQRLSNFIADSNDIYTEFSPYDESIGGIGGSQPFVYTNISDSDTDKNLTEYDTFAFPIGSTVRDVERVGKFMASGTGLLFIGTQLLLQNTNAFNETRIYNPLSVLTATARPRNTWCATISTTTLEHRWWINEYIIERHRYSNAEF